MFKMFYILMISSSILLSDYLGGYQGAGYRYGTNARQISLGNSMLCDANQGFNAFLNPALLSKTNGLEIGSSYFLMSLDRYVQVLSVSRNLSSFGGASLSYFESGVSDIYGKDFSNQPTGVFQSKDSYLMFSFGSIVLNRFSVGLNFKAMYSSIANYNSSGFSGDIGFVYELSDNISSAIMIKNIFSSNVWDNTNLAESLLQIKSFGLRFNINNNIKIHSLLENMRPNGLDVYKLKNGIEWNFLKYSLRLGVIQNSGQFSNQSFDVKILAGFGFDIKLLESNKIRLDYCIDFGKENEGISNLISLSIK